MILMDIKSLADADGNVLHFVGVQHDVTEQMRDQQALKIANEAAGIASEAKRSFLATISHELRTPMTAVLDILDLSKVESGKLQFVHEDIDIRSVVAEVESFELDCRVDQRLSRRLSFAADCEKKCGGSPFPATLLDRVNWRSKQQPLATPVRFALGP